MDRRQMNPPFYRGHPGFVDYHCFAACAEAPTAANGYTADRLQVVPWPIRLLPGAATWYPDPATVHPDFNSILFDVRIAISSLRAITPLPDSVEIGPVWFHEPNTPRLFTVLGDDIFRLTVRLSDPNPDHFVSCVHVRIPDTLQGTFEAHVAMSLGEAQPLAIPRGGSWARHLNRPDVNIRWRQSEAERGLRELGAGIGPLFNSPRASSRIRVFFVRRYPDDLYGIPNEPRLPEDPFPPHLLHIPRSLDDARALIRNYLTNTIYDRGSRAMLEVLLYTSHYNPSNDMDPEGPPLLAPYAPGDLGHRAISDEQRVQLLSWIEDALPLDVENGLRANQVQPPLPDREGPPLRRSSRLRMRTVDDNGEGGS